MTAATLTPGMAASDLRDELRALLERLDGGDVSTVEELREAVNEVTKVVRRTRGRITRLAKREPKLEAKPEPAAPKAESGAAERTRERTTEGTEPRPSAAPSPAKSEVSAVTARTPDGTMPRTPAARPETPAHSRRTWLSAGLSLVLAVLRGVRMAGARVARRAVRAVRKAAGKARGWVRRRVPAGRAERRHGTAYGWLAVLGLALPISLALLGVYLALR